jgi:hypothetical protein
MSGSKPGERRGGRQLGAKNKRTRELDAARIEAAAKIEQALGVKAFEGDAHALLIAVYKDIDQPLELRLDAARAAISFEKPRLSAISASIKGEDFANMSDAELDEFIVGKAGALGGVLGKAVKIKAQYHED